MKRRFLAIARQKVPDKEMFYGGQVMLAEAYHLDICGKTQENLPQVNQSFNVPVNFQKFLPKLKTYFKFMRHFPERVSK